MSKKTEYMVAETTIIFATSRGPGHKLNKDQRIEVSKVNEDYVKGVRAGKYKARIEFGDGGDSGDGGSSDQFDPSEFKVDDVVAYLNSLEGDDADAEIARVKAAEAENKVPPHRPSARITDFEKKG